MMKRTILAVGFLLCMRGLANADDFAIQRPDSCIILDADAAKVRGDQLVWDFELKHPGTYVVELVVPIDDAKDARSATVWIDGVGSGGRQILGDGREWNRMASR